MKVRKLRAELDPRPCRNITSTTLAQGLPSQPCGPSLSALSIPWWRQSLGDSIVGDEFGENWHENADFFTASWIDTTPSIVLGRYSESLNDSPFRIR